MNVAFGQWIPVVNAAGKRDLVSLHDVLVEGNKYIDLAVRPHERVALMRLFLCVAHTALDGPKNYDEWCKVPERLPEAAKTYLTEWKDSFELFHPTKPWLQVAELDTLPEKDEIEDEQEWSSLNRLCYTKSSGITPTLFDQASNGNSYPKYSPSDIALNLLTFQNYFVAGGKASTRFWGNRLMNNPPNPKGGPCAGKSTIFTFLRGQNLGDTVYLNLSTYDDLKYVYGDIKTRLGNPLWEMPIKCPDDSKAINNATRTHLGRLVPQTRILRLNEDCKRVLLGAGFEYPKFQDDTFEPDIFATVILNKENDRELLSARPDRAVWRDLHSLVVRRKSATERNRGPLCLLNVADGKGCDLIVSALLTNPKQAAELVSLIESVYPTPANLLSSSGAHNYEAEVKIAEQKAVFLGRAVEEYRKAIDEAWEDRVRKSKSKWELLSKLHSIATVHYWTAVEKNLSLLFAHVESINTDDPITSREAWRKMLAQSARDAYCRACGRETPRHVRAFAKGWDKLTGKRKESENTDNAKEDVA